MNLQLPRSYTNLPKWSYSTPVTKAIQVGAEDFWVRSVSANSRHFHWSIFFLFFTKIFTKYRVSFRFLCRALSGYILAQLPDMKGEVQVVRQTAGAPAIVGQPGGNTECVKVLLGLDMGRSQGKIKSCAELALKQVSKLFSEILWWMILFCCFADPGSQ